MVYSLLLTWAVARCECEHWLAAPLCLAPISLFHSGRTWSLHFPFLTEKMNGLLSSHWFSCFRQPKGCGPFPSPAPACQSLRSLCSLGLQPCKSVLCNGMWREWLLRERAGHCARGALNSWFINHFLENQVQKPGLQIKLFYLGFTNTIFKSVSGLVNLY